MIFKKNILLCIFPILLGMIAPSWAQDITPPEDEAPDLKIEKESDSDQDDKTDDDSEDNQPDGQGNIVSQDEGISIGATEDKDSSSDEGKSEKKSGKVKIFSPWPAKPLGQAPAGWKYVPAPKGTSPYKEKVTLKDGRKLTLSITPYLLVPDSDQSSSFSIAEPGYNPEDMLTQKTTIGAILKRSTEQIEKSEQITSITIRQLQDLLVSLPSKQQ